MSGPTLDDKIDEAKRLIKSGKLADAEALCRRILAARQNDPATLNLLATIARRTGHYDAALELVAQAIALRPSGEFHRNRGHILGILRRRDEARQALRTGMELSWTNFHELCELGDLMLDLDFGDEALEAYQRCAKLKPQSVMGLLGSGSALYQLGKLTEAMTCLDEALKIDPNCAGAHLNRAHILLTLGDFKRGWPEFLWRWQMSNMQQRKKSIGKPMWNGEELNGRRILLAHEVGIGETINFVRYVPLVKARGGTVILSCHPEVFTLLRHYPGIDECIAGGQPLPQFDCFCAIPDLPAVLQTDSNSIPPESAHFNIDPAAIQKWKERLAGDDRRKVGLVWSGNPRHAMDPQRSIRLAELAPLSQKHVRLISLQKNPAAGQIATAGFPVDDWTAELNDFADTAALIQNLDLIITVDTAVLHLAGALNKPVWALVRFIGDWRWGLQGATTHWYPSVRLIRQRRLWDWSDAIAETAEALSHL